MFWKFCNFNLNQLRIENQATLNPAIKNKIKFQNEFRPNLKPVKNSGQKEGQGGKPILNAKANNQKVEKLIFKKNNKRDFLIKELIPIIIKRIELITPWSSLNINNLLSPISL